jgi:hypothetical protein
MEMKRNDYTIKKISSLDFYTHDFAYSANLKNKTKAKTESLQKQIKERNYKRRVSSGHS